MQWMWGGSWPYRRMPLALDASFIERLVRVHPEGSPQRANGLTMHRSKNCSIPTAVELSHELAVRQSATQSRLFLGGLAIVGLRISHRASKPS